MVVFLVQGVFPSLHHGGPSAATFGLILLIVCIPAIMTLLTALAVHRARRLLRRRRSGRSLLRAAEGVEARARAMMSELCPHGWRAQITLFGPGDELPAGAPAGERSRVALDWAELDDELGRVAVVRRVWAPSIGEALEAMVQDRRTDETLEQIERGAGADAASWPDL